MKNETAYSKYASATAKKSNTVTNCAKAFLTGGFICVAAEALSAFYTYAGFTRENVSLLVPVTLIFVTAFLTGIGVFDNIARAGGAGTLVPITGFANAVVSPALDTKSEGMVAGLGVKIFTIAGPVILYGTIASFLYGVVYYLYKIIF